MNTLKLFSRTASAIRLGCLALGATVALSATMAAASSPAQAADPVRVGNSQPTFSFIPLDIGLKEGFFAKHGIDVHKTDFSGSSQLHQAIAAGSIDIGLGAGPEFGFLVKGAPEKGIGAMSDAAGDLALVVLKGGPIKTIADLKGQKVSMSTRGSLTEWAGRKLSEQQGWGPNGIQLVPLGAFSAQTAALTTHQIAGMVVEATTAARLEDNGTGTTLLHFDKVVPHFHIHTFWASDAFIKSHPDDIKAFMAGWFDSLDYMKAHRDVAVQVAAQVLNLKPEVAGKLYDFLLPFYNNTGKYDPQALDAIAQSMVDLKLFPKKPDLTKYYTEEFLPKRN